MTSLRKSSLFRNFTRRMLAPCYESFGTCYRSHLRVSCSQDYLTLEDGTDTFRNVRILDPWRWDRYVVPKRLNAWPSKMGPIRCPETSECLTLEDGTDTLSRNVWMLDPRRWNRYVVSKRRQQTTNIRCVKARRVKIPFTLRREPESTHNFANDCRGAPIVDSRGSPLRCTGVICDILTQCFLGTLQKRLLTYTSTVWCRGSHTFAL